ncbi:hypothetical protein KBZ18_12845 [Synechococcus sp. Cruz-9H2]|uniref:hypothetical protein n=1 Tax=unclassified Synechococcus TaxID=2626047 RepID=UPI0020CF886F|nr:MULTISPECIES: hypothetical protein [unclassified Synechococcus]MCP9820372.1 hypothetical protein [Synechococcus sp. Cruz-9H2]MCP9844765.1 hypothetical protein [Synechococcus sp. Edmonson 11F2]MCP9856802.1 hypothetical protein [Synechococcus sp. Cruz-9C9]MCP9864173.1 hypothetical protein [Synechococcus sp. Cruz-7E5]MCP9871368.1 hypothetical protein [Synechococcus sp. Cruz-7B9]
MLATREDRPEDIHRPKRELKAETAATEARVRQQEAAAAEPEAAEATASGDPSLAPAFRGET